MLGRGAQATVVLLHDGESSPVVAKQIDAVGLSTKDVQAVQREVLILKENLQRAVFWLKFRCHRKGKPNLHYLAST